MAFGRLERSAGPRPIGEINMTPLIDVMLVLLVIFMIAAPLMTSSLKLDLPQVQGGQPNEAGAFVSVAVNATGQLYLGDEPVTEELCAQRLRGAAKANPQLEVQLRAARQVPYGRVAQVIDLVQQAGLSRIGFVTEAAGSASAPR